MFDACHFYIFDVFFSFYSIVFYVNVVVVIVMHVLCRETTLKLLFVI